MNKLKVCEIFKSIQGESSFSGFVCSFVRLSGCNLRCSYCDTGYALTGGDELSIDEIVQAVSKHGAGLVEITGGEPLFQENTPGLCRAFLDLGYTVLVETNGSYDISIIPGECRRIVDVKCPESGMGDTFLKSNLNLLSDNDELKYVISGERDFEWAIGHIFTHNLQDFTVHFTPNTLSLPIETLAAWIIKRNAPVRLGIQLHKLIWGGQRGV